MAFYYCDYKNLATHDISAILGSLIRQFAIRDETSFGILSKFYQSQQSGVYRTAGSATPDSLLQLLNEVTEKYSSAIVIIDGLDEISRDRQDTVDLIQSMNQPNNKIKTLFASRRETDIEACLGDYVKISIAARSSDLELYVASEIESRTRKKQLNIRDPDLKEKILKRLINEAEGMSVESLTIHIILIY